MGYHHFSNLIGRLFSCKPLTGICARNTDSNGFSIRVNGEDQGLQYSLRIVRQNGEMYLAGVSNRRNQPMILVGRVGGETSDFARISLAPGWRFTKRTFDSQTLGHVYLTYEGATPIASLPSSTASRPQTTPATTSATNSTGVETSGAVSPNMTDARTMSTTTASSRGRNSRAARRANRSINSTNR
jgi:hypothetical protein